MEESNRSNHTASDLRDEICAMLGGRAAEEVILGDVSKGAWQDLRMATQMAGEMVKELGFGARTGLVSIPKVGHGYYHTSLSPETMRVAEEEIHKILEVEYSRAKALIRYHRPAFDRLVDALVTREVLHEAEIKDILRTPPASGWMSRMKRIMWG